METKAIKDFLNAMSDSIENEKVELFKKIIDSSEIKKYNNPNEFFLCGFIPLGKIHWWLFKI